MKTFEIDDISPPGAWGNEMAAAPWAYGQTQRQQVQSALVAIRAAGLWHQAECIEKEIKALETELAHQRR